MVSIRSFCAWQELLTPLPKLLSLAQVDSQSLEGVRVSVVKVGLSCPAMPSVRAGVLQHASARAGSPHTSQRLLQIVDASILKQYIFQKGFITEGAKAKREAEAQNATLQVGKPSHNLCASSSDPA